MGTGNEFLMLFGVIWALCFEFMALKQKQIMRLFGFSTIAAIGYIVAGISAPSAAGAVGGVAEIINFVVMRILIFSAILALVSAVKTPDIDKMKGVGKVMPITTTLLAFGIIASMGLSPFKASLSKILIFFSVVESGTSICWLTVGIMILALVCQACYFLRLVQKLIFAPYNGEEIKENLAAPMLMLAVIFAAGTAYIGYAGEEILHFAVGQVQGLRGGEVVLPHLESEWPLLVTIPYYGAFAAFLLGRILPGLRNIAVFLLTLAPVVMLLSGQAGALGPINWFFAFFMALMMCLIGLYSIGFMAKEKAQGRFHFWFLYLTAALMGLGVSKSLGDFYAFWEMMTISSYFLALQRETVEARKAALTYFMAAASAGYLFLVAIFSATANNGFEFAALAGAPAQLSAGVLAVLFLIGLGIKAEMFPLYGWVPKLYQESFAPVSAVFASVLSKTGIIGLLGVMFIALGGVKGSPEIMLGFAWVGAITMVLGAIAMLLQSDMQRLLAYCSITQMGYVMIGISLGSALGVSGGLFHALNHMLCKGLLFLCVGAVFLQTGTKDLNKLGGLARKMPITAFAVLIGAFGIAGIPPLNGFVSKWMIYQACIENGTSAGLIFGVLTLVASTGTLAAFIKLVHSAFFGLAPEECADVKEVPFIMQLSMLVLSVLCILFGFFPQMALGLISAMQIQLGVEPLNMFNYPVVGSLVVAMIIFAVGLALLLGMFASGKQKPERAVPVYAGGKELEPNNFTSGDIQIGANNFYPSVELLIEQFFKICAPIKNAFLCVGKVLNAGEEETVERRENNVGSIRETL